MEAESKRLRTDQRIWSRCGGPCVSERGQAGKRRSGDTDRAATHAEPEEKQNYIFFFVFNNELKVPERNKQTQTSPGIMKDLEMMTFFYSFQLTLAVTCFCYVPGDERRRSSASR